MKILFILTPAFDPDSGGVQRTTYKLGKYFTEQGHDVAYFSLANSGHVPTDYGKLYYASQANKHKNPENLKEVKKAMKDFRPEIVINQMPYEQKLRELLGKEKEKLNYILIGCLRNSLFSVVRNLDAYGSKILPNPLNRLFQNRLGNWLLLQLHYFSHKRALKAILDQHDRFVLLTPPNQEELQYFVGDYKQEKVTAIPNSIPKIFEQDIGQENKQKIMLYVGRLNIPQKRADLLLPFWKQVQKSLPNWEFVIVGNGPYKPTMESQIEKEAIPRITLKGYQNPDAYYKEAPIFVMPSAYEGFPNVILEAQSHGLIPLAFDSYPALSWIVNDQKDAMMSTPYDTQEMANQAINLANDSTRLESMRQKAYQNAGRFTIDKVGQAWCEFFEDLRI